MAFAEFNIEENVFIGYALSGVDTKKFTVTDLNDGNYSIYGFWVNSCGNLVGDTSTALDITIVDGLIISIPTQDPSNYRLSNKAGGEFKLDWEYYNLTSNDVKPTLFHIHDDVTGKIAEVIYNSSFSHFSYTTDKDYSHNQVVTFKIKAVKGTKIKDNDTEISGTADTQGPDIIVSSENIELI